MPDYREHPLGSKAIRPALDAALDAYIACDSPDSMDDIRVVIEAFCEHPDAKPYLEALRGAER